MNNVIGHWTGVRMIKHIYFSSKYIYIFTVECGCDKVRMLDLPSVQSSSNGYYDKTNTVQVSYSYLVLNVKTSISHLNTLLGKVICSVGNF